MIGVIIIFILIVIIISCIRIVPQAEEVVVEFLGRYQTTWESGLHIKIPILQRIAKRVSLKEKVADFPPQKVITKDNVSMQIDTVVYYEVMDSNLYTYGVEHPSFALENLTATTLRNIIGELTLDECLTSREVINTKMGSVVDDATNKWGIKVNRVELKNIIPPAEIQEAMEKQMKAEREKRQTILESEAHKQSVVMRAEGDKQSTILKAEAERDAAIARAKGEAESIRLVYEAQANGLKMLSAAKIDKAAMTIKKLEALKALGDGKATKIIVPTELVSVASKLQFEGEMLGIHKSETLNENIIEESIEESKKQKSHNNDLYKKIGSSLYDDCCDEGERSRETKRMSKRN